MRKNIMLATTAVGALASPAFADDKMEIGAFLGIHLWNDNNELGKSDNGPNDEIENSPIFGVRIARRLASAVSLEGELGLSPATTDKTDTDVVALAYRLHLLVHPARFVDGRLEPFALVGFGGMTAATSDEAVVGNDTDFVVHGGIGFKYRVGRDWGVRFDARLLLPPAIEGTLTADGEFLIGIYKTFPPKPAPKPAEVPPPQPTSTDKDGDGLLDESDQCPTEGEDRDGFRDDDGCPDPDNDGDGNPDVTDKCSTQTETLNGFQDEDGCPDEAPAAVKKFTGAIRGIDFATNSDVLTPGSSTVLDEAVKLLAEYPTLRLEISGHTDATGEAEYNRDLSRRRAEAVKNYLTARGVAVDRLEAVGRGPDQPVGDNTTPEGRAKNRRVEFKPR